VSVANDTAALDRKAARVANTMLDYRVPPPAVEALKKLIIVLAEQHAADQLQIVLDKVKVRR